ncbi:MAG: hypothetical protein ACRDN0_24670, partial [Trebonia sp.]
MVGIARQWNTWLTQDRLAMVHLPSGFCLRFSAFSSNAGEYRLLGEGAGVTPLEHMPDATLVRARIAHA